MSPTHQTLMTAFYVTWGSPEHVDKSQAEVLALFDARTVAAVQLGNLNYQVCNGGFSQWWANGYGPDHWQALRTLTRRGAAQGVPCFEALHALFEDLAALDPEDPVVCPDRGGLSQGADFFDILEDSGLDARFCAIEGRVEAFQVLLDRFDEPVAV